MFLVQILLPVQAHSRIDTNEQGVAVVICTLQGDKAITIDLEGSDAHADQAFSAAMQFSDLVNDFSPVLMLPRPNPVVLRRIPSAQHAAVSVASLPKVDPSSRAPPRL